MRYDTAFTWYGSFYIPVREKNHMQILNMNQVQEYVILVHLHYNPRF